MDGAWRDKKGFYFLKNRQYGKLCTYGLIFAKVSAGILPLVEMLLTARFIDAVRACLCPMRSGRIFSCW